MKKRILSALLTSALILSLTACGADTETPESTTEGTKATTTAAEKEDTAEATTTTAPEETEETTTTTEAPPVEVQKITDKPDIYDDCMVFEDDGITYVYNITNNKIYKYEGDRDVYMFNGYKGKLALTYGGFYNLETQEYYDCNNLYPGALDYNAVYKIENNFDGDTYSFGIIDKNGEWVLPLSSDYAICDLAPTTNIRNTSSSLVCVDTWTVYDWKNDKIITEGELGNSFLNVYGDNILFTSNSWFDTFTVYNVNKGESRVINDVDGACLETDLYAVVTSIDYNAEYCVIYGDNLEKLHEITGYNVTAIYDATEDYAVFGASGSDSSTYTIITDKSGNRIIEPSQNFGWGGRIIGDYVVFDETDKILNCKTGEIKEYANDDTYNIIGCHSETGKLIVSSDDAYYIADISDPDTLINPFEIAE